jgi:hypothetical protein
VVNICKWYNWHGYLARKLNHTITRLWLDDRRSGFFLRGSFSLLVSVQTVSRVHAAPYPMGTAVISVELTWTTREAFLNFIRPDVFHIKTKYSRFPSNTSIWILHKDYRCVRRKTIVLCEAFR